MTGTVRRSPFAPATGAYRPRGFSLAELMIALVILGLGLLFIAAALPAGLEYTRQTVDKANAEAAGSYALNEIEAALRTSRDLYDHGLAAQVPPVVERLDCVQRPRRRVALAGQPVVYTPDDKYEPMFKVRPLVTGNIVFGPTSTERELVDDTEQVISAYFTAMGMTFTQDPLEYDFNRNAGLGLSLGETPVLPGVARVYPPIAPVLPFDARDFMQNQSPYPQYLARYLPANNVLTAAQRRSEREKAFDRRVGWTAFYRRVSYEITDPDGAPNSGDEYAADPLTYELIVVVTRRTTRQNHRFARQDLSVSGIRAFERPQATGAYFSDPSPNPPTPGFVGTDGGGDRLAPTPWLVVFDTTQPFPASPTLVRGTDYYETFPDTANLNYMERTLSANFVAPPTISFVCTTEVGQLLAEGSILIPAFNDQRYLPPAGGGAAQAVGFIPSAPESLPIYEVLEVTDGPNPDTQKTVVVKNNGYYPWLNPNLALDARNFPFWIIPPCFAERAGGQPVYDRTSPVLRVFRETIQMPEMN